MDLELEHADEFKYTKPNWTEHDESNREHNINKVINDQCCVIDGCGGVGKSHVCISVLKPTDLYLAYTNAAICNLKK